MSVIVDEAGAKAWLVDLPEWDELARDRLDRLVAALTEENTQQNLVSAASLDHVWLRHILDSAQLLRLVPRETSSPWLDLGTGAGFPGLVIAALRPEAEVVMIESRGRRVEWLQRMCAALALPQARVEGSRLETLPQRTAAVISARAFAPLEKLLPLSARFSTSDTIWLLPKGRGAAQELASLNGWRHRFHVEPSLSDAQAGIITGQLNGKAGAKR